MATRKRAFHQIISTLRQAEVELSQGRMVGQVCRSLVVTEQTDEGRVSAGRDQ